VSILFIIRLVLRTGPAHPFDGKREGEDRRGEGGCQKRKKPRVGGKVKFNLAVKKA